LAVASLREAIDRVNLQEALSAASAEQTAFQRVVGKIAEQCTSVTAEALDRTIIDSLRRIAEALDLDRAIVWRAAPGHRLAQPAYYWQGINKIAPSPCQHRPFRTSCRDWPSGRRTGFVPSTMFRIGSTAKRSERASFARPFGYPCRCQTQPRGRCASSR
jgi:hypothetical protein